MDKKSILAAVFRCCWRVGDGEQQINLKFIVDSEKASRNNNKFGRNKPKDYKRILNPDYGPPKPITYLEYCQ